MKNSLLYLLVISILALAYIFLEKITGNNKIFVRIAILLIVVFIAVTTLDVIKYKRLKKRRSGLGFSQFRECFSQNKVQEDVLYWIYVNIQERATGEVPVLPHDSLLDVWGMDEEEINDFMIDFQEKYPNMLINDVSNVILVSDLIDKIVER